MKKDKIIVAAHDAGGAEIVAAYIANNTAAHDFICFVDGPAEKIFGRYGLSYSVAPKNKEDILSLLNLHKDAVLVLTSTGWTELELNFLQCAKKISIPTAAYLEHWSAYRERFGFPESGWENNLPDEIWIGDKEALSLAQKYFLATKILEVPNCYWPMMLERYNKIKEKTDNGEAIVFMSEPTSYEKIVLEDLLNFLQGQNSRLKIIIRFHPSEDHGKYDPILSCFPSLDIIKSNAPDIVEDIARAAIVIGMESVALVNAVICGKTAVSIVPDKNKILPLPFKEIVKAHLADELKKFDLFKNNVILKQL